MSVVMPTFNKAPYLDLTLASFRRQSHRRFEIVVVADGATDDTGAVVARHRRHLDIRYCRQRHAGRAAARNAGLAAAAGDLVIFSDDDYLVGRTFVAEHLAAHRRMAAPGFALGWMHGILTIVHRDLFGPLHPVLWRALGRRHHRRPPIAFHLTDAHALASRFSQVVARLRTIHPDWERKVAPAVAQFGVDLRGLAAPWFLGSTGNMSAPRALVQEAGGFDPRYVGYGMEDTDLCYRMVSAGARVRVARRAASYHQLHPVPAPRADEMRASLRYFLGKYRTLEAWLFALWFCGAIDLRSANAAIRDARRPRAAGVGQARQIARLRRQVEQHIGRL